MRLPLLVAVLTAANAPLALAQTIVGDGADLQAAIDAATSGDVIEIQSDETFGAIRIANKSLTLRAGDGFSPAITGPGTFTPLAITIGSGADGDNSVVTLEGLQVVGAQTVVGLENAPAGSVQTLTVTIQDCNLVGGFASFTAVDRTLDLTLVDSTVRPLAPLDPTAPGSQIQVLSTNVLGPVDARSGGSIRIEDSVLADDVTLVGLDGQTTTLDIHRTRVRGGLEFRSSTTGAVEVFAESSLFEFTEQVGTPFGISARRAGSPASLRGVNCTVRGYTSGLAAQGGALIEIENSLFDGNGLDLNLINADPASLFRNSIFPDGSFDGVDGNTSSPAVFGCDDELVAGTNGVDAGDSLVADLGATDLFGAPRIQDGDGDGTAQVSLGAVETVADFGAQAILFNGSEINPVDLSVLTPPALGTLFELSVVTDASTAATVAQIDLPSPAPFPNPVGAGEIFLQLSGAAVGDFQVPGGSHILPIPANLGLLGANLRVQGFRVSVVPTLEVTALNAFDLDFGSCP